MNDKLLVDITFNSCPENLQTVRGMVQAGARRAGCDEALVRQLMLVVDEACSNIIRHAYHGDPAGSIRLRLTREGDDLVFRLRDYADPVDSGCIKPRNLDECRPGGLGVNFIDSVMDDWHFQRPHKGRGNVLKMTRRIG